MAPAWRSNIWSTLDIAESPFLNGPHDWNSSIERLAGYRDVLEQYGISFDPTLVAEGTWEVQSGYPAVKKFLELPDRPTAIFAANDLMALGAIYAIQDAGFNRA